MNLLYNKISYIYDRYNNLVKNIDNYNNEIAYYNIMQHHAISSQYIENTNERYKNILKKNKKQIKENKIDDLNDLKIDVNNINMKEITQIKKRVKKRINKNNKYILKIINLVGVK